MRITNFCHTHAHTTHTHLLPSQGAQFALAIQFAAQKNKKYIAIASSGVDGHVFAFNSPPKKSKSIDDMGCDTPCSDMEVPPSSSLQTRTQNLVAKPSPKPATNPTPPIALSRTTGAVAPTKCARA